MALPTLTVAELKAQARLDSGVSSSDYSDANLLKQFNIAYAKLTVLLANLGEDYFEEQRVKFSLVANSGLYSLPTDCIALKGIRLAYTGTPVAPSAYVVASSYDPSEVHIITSDEENIPTSNPIYDLTNNYFRLKPKPTVAVTNGGLLDYIAMPSALVNSADVPIIPIAYQDKIAIFGAKQMAFKFEKWSKHSRLDNMWNSTMAELQDRIAERDLNRPVRFRSPFEVGAAVNQRRIRELP